MLADKQAVLYRGHTAPRCMRRPVGTDLALAKCPRRWQFGTNDPGGFLAAHSWQAGIYDIYTVARSLGRWPPPGVPGDFE